MVDETTVDEKRRKPLWSIRDAGESSKCQELEHGASRYKNKDDSARWTSGQPPSHCTIMNPRKTGSSRVGNIAADSAHRHGTSGPVSPSDQAIWNPCRGCKQPPSQLSRTHTRGRDAAGTSSVFIFRERRIKHETSRFSERLIPNLTGPAVSLPWTPTQGIRGDRRPATNLIHFTCQTNEELHDPFFSTQRIGL